MRVVKIDTNINNIDAKKNFLFTANKKSKTSTSYNNKNNKNSTMGIILAVDTFVATNIVSIFDINNFANISFTTDIANTRGASNTTANIADASSIVNL